MTIKDKSLQFLLNCKICINCKKLFNPNKTAVRIGKDYFCKEKCYFEFYNTDTSTLIGVK